jgi:hypothetical protein
MPNKTKASKKLQRQKQPQLTGHVRSANIFKSYPMARTMQDPTIISGSDFLGKVTLKATTTDAADQILLSGAVSPTDYPGTRLSQLGELWERFRFGKFSIRWVPSVPTTVACQLILYQDLDPNDDPTIISDPDALVRQATAQVGSRQWNAWAPQTIPLAQYPDDQMFYTGIDQQNQRFSRQGTWYLIQVTTPMNALGVSLPNDIQGGSLFVDWEMCAAVPQINPRAVTTQLGGSVTTGGFVDTYISGTFDLVGNSQQHKAPTGTVAVPAGTKVIGVSGLNSLGPEDESSYMTVTLGAAETSFFMNVSYQDKLVGGVSGIRGGAETDPSADGYTGFVPLELTGPVSEEIVLDAGFQKTTGDTQEVKYRQAICFHYIGNSPPTFSGWSV